LGLPCAAPKTPEKSGELRFSCRDVTSSLIELGADIEAKSANGYTPLHWAAWINSLDVARLLLDRGAEVDAKDDDGWTPLNATTFDKSLDVARLLLDHGANTEGIDLSWMN